MMARRHAAARLPRYAAILLLLLLSTPHAHVITTTRLFYAIATPRAALLIFRLHGTLMFRHAAMILRAVVAMPLPRCCAIDALCLRGAMRYMRRAAVTR